MTTKDSQRILQGVIFNILYEMRLAPMGPLSEAAERVAQVIGMSQDAVLALPRYGAALDDGDNGPTATMEEDNALGKYVTLSDVLALSVKDATLVQGAHGLPRLPTPASGERTYTGHGNFEENPYFTEQQVLQVQQQAYQLGLAKALMQQDVHVAHAMREDTARGN